MNTFAENKQEYIHLSFYKNSNNNEQHIISYEITNKSETPLLFLNDQNIHHHTFLELRKNDQTIEPADIRRHMSLPIQQTYLKKTDFYLLKPGENKKIAEIKLSFSKDGHDLKWGPFYYKNLKGKYQIKLIYPKLDGRLFAKEGDKLIKKDEEIYTLGMSSDTVEMEI